ncbi:hypothetical protein DSC45_23575 [Streptomyces sp. YIM 130001]|nr:hypothetical protein DSC45_23575 [Streptomyces sp. YIM 130001]
MLNVVWVVADDTMWLGRASPGALQAALTKLGRRCGHGDAAQLRAVGSVPGAEQMTGDDRRRISGAYRAY